MSREDDMQCEFSLNSNSHNLVSNSNYMDYQSQISDRNLSLDDFIDSYQSPQYQSKQSKSEIIVVKIRMGLIKLTQQGKGSFRILIPQGNGQFRFNIPCEDYKTNVIECQSKNMNTKPNIVNLDLFGERLIQYNPTTHKIQSSLFVNHTFQNIVFNFQVMKLCRCNAVCMKINLRDKKLKLIRKFILTNSLEGQQIQQDKSIIYFNRDVKSIMIEQYQEGRQIVYRQGHIVIDKWNGKIKNEDKREKETHLNIIHDGQIKAYCPSIRFLVAPLHEIIAFDYKEHNELNIVNFFNLRWSRIRFSYKIKQILPIYYGILVVSQNDSELEINILDSQKLRGI